MAIVKRFFWNSDQARLRTGWRFVLQFVLFVIIALVLNQLVTFGLAYALMLLGSAIPAGGSLEGAATQVIGSSFVLTVVSSAIELGLTLLSFWLAARWIDRRPFADFGFHMGRRWWLDMGFGLVLGAVLLTIIFGIELAAGWVTITGTLTHTAGDWGFAAEWIAALAGFIVVGFREELLFRSYYVKNLAEAIPSRWRGKRLPILFGWLLPAVLFGLAHMGNPNATWTAAANIFLAGLLLGLPYLLTGDIAASVGLHITWNLFEGNVFGFPVSGMAAGASAISIRQGGPELWTGGSFGPEAGMVCILAMLIGAGLIVLWARWRNGEVKLFEALADPPARISRTPPVVAGEE